MISLARSATLLSARPIRPASAPEIMQTETGSLAIAASTLAKGGGGWQYAKDPSRLTRDSDEVGPGRRKVEARNPKCEGSPKSENRKRSCAAAGAAVTLPEMKRTRIAVLGVYRSGSTAVAGALHHLGVDMGPPYFEGFYESAGLSKQLRRWWDEPRLVEKVGRAKRVRVLEQWIKEREAGGVRWVGMKHPLLSLCGDDLVQAWGEDTRFIRCCRPLEDSIDSLKRLGRSVDGAFLKGH